MSIEPKRAGQLHHMLEDAGRDTLHGRVDRTALAVDRYYASRDAQRRSQGERSSAMPSNPAGYFDSRDVPDVREVQRMARIFEALILEGMARAHDPEQVKAVMDGAIGLLKAIDHNTASGANLIELLQHITTAAGSASPDKKF